MSPLYKSDQPGNFVDMAVDENGLWALFGLASENNTVSKMLLMTQPLIANPILLYYVQIILKIEPYSLELQWAWNMSLNPFQVSTRYKGWKAYENILSCMLP